MMVPAMADAFNVKQIVFTGVSAHCLNRALKQGVKSGFSSDPELAARFYVAQMKKGALRRPFSRIRVGVRD
jgi:hypothetical protein